MIKKVLLLFILGFVLSASPSYADNSGDSCSAGEFGTTKLASSKEDIIACLKSGGSYIWKGYTSGQSTLNCRVCLQFIDGGGRKGAGPWRCTPYGGGVSKFATDSNSYDPDGARISLDCK